MIDNQVFVQIQIHFCKLLTSEVHLRKTMTKEKSNRQMRFNRLGTLCAVSIFFLVTLLQSARSQDAPVLEGNIKIDDEVSAIPREYLPGNKFESGPEQVDNSTWYRIPQWFAGQWTSDGEQHITKKNLATGRSTHEKARVEFPKFVYLGCVKDSGGTRWERAPLNRWRLTQYEGQSPIYSMFSSTEVQQPDADHIAIKSVGLHLVVDSHTKKINKASQVESLQIYTRQTDTLMTLENTTRSYDETGKAYQEKVAVSDMAKVNDIDLDALKLKPLREAFQEYAIEHHLSETSPQSQKPIPWFLK